MAVQETYADHAATLVLKNGDHCTEDEYFAFCDQSEERWEFIADKSLTGEPLETGVIRAMIGGTADHSGIAMNLGRALANALGLIGNENCRVFGSDLRVRTTEGRNTFPDVSVVCGPIVYHRKLRDTITNPIFLAEVLSPSTRAYDRGEKRIAYQTIPTLLHYLLIEAGTSSIEVLTRTSEGWEAVVVTGLDGRVALAGLGIEIALAHVYALVAFDEGGS
jgi:Uma2 family endonuclease